jgi:glutathione synthase/RimK-type ligase-like ATP-grasp enzyme
MYFSYHKKSRPTGEILADVLGIDHGIDPPENLYGDINLIRWGNRRNPSVDRTYELVLNNAESIGKASDKFNSLHIMAENGINVPIPVEGDDFDDLIEQFGYPIIGRQFHHARGTDINLILQKRDFRRVKSDYYIPYIPTNREYRIHVVRDKVIRVQGKYLDFPEQSVPHIRNYATGYRFRTPNIKLKSDRLEAAIKAVSSLGLDFGAVDLIIADDGQYYILEVNTAPSCSRATGEAYIKEFANLLGVDNGQISLQSLANLEAEERDSEEEEDDGYEEEE